MRKTVKLAAGAAVLATGLALAGCGGSDAVTEDDTAVSDVDPGEAEGTIDDTTAIDATIGADNDAAVDSVAPGEMTADGTGDDTADDAATAEDEGADEAEGANQ